MVPGRLLRIRGELTKVRLLVFTQPQHLCLCCAVCCVVCLQAVMSDGSVNNGTLAESQAQASAIWRVREGVTEALQRRGAYRMCFCVVCLCHDGQKTRQGTLSISNNAGASQCDAATHCASRQGLLVDARRLKMLGLHSR
jgi:hypothetical protein